MRGWQLWTLVVAAAPTLAQPNRFEPNQTRRTAARLEPGDYKRLQCDEEDWYVLALPRGRRLEVSAQFSNKDGDLELEMRDSRGRLLAWSRGQRDEESLSFAAPEECAVFLHVYNARNLYDLHVGLAQSAYQGGGALEGVSCYGADWYAVDVPAGKQLRAETSVAPAEGDLDLALFDAEGTEVQSSTERGPRDGLRWVATEPRRMLLQVAHVQRGSARYGLQLVVGEAALDDLERVLGRDRPVGKGNDLLELRSGDRLQGEVLDEAFHLVTPYAELTLKRDRLAGVDLERARNELESVVTVEGHRYGGIIRAPTVKFRLADQVQALEVPRERIVRVLFGRRGGERGESRPKQYFVLRSGEHFGGQLLEAEGWSLDLGFARIALDPARLQSIRFEREGRATVRRLDRSTLQGRLAVERVAIALDSAEAERGPRVDLHVERLDTIYLQEGMDPEKVIGGADAGSFDFEKGLEPWVAQGTPLTNWFPTAQDAGQGQGCVRACGPNGGNYADNVHTTLTSPPLGIRGLATPCVSFQVRARLERGQDFLVVRASYDGGQTFVELHRLSGDVEWTPLSFPLQPGGEQVVIQFGLLTDGSIVSQGVWLDAVEIVDHSGQAR